MASDLANRTEKRCPKCKTVKPITEFNKDSVRVDGRYIYCRPCHASYRLRKPPEFHRDYEMRRNYGIGIKEYDQMLANQGGVCAICHEKCIQKPSLAIDHDHETGRVRALLCGRCNQGIGLFRERLDLLLAAATYLEEHQGVTDG